MTDSYRDLSDEDKQQISDDSVLDELIKKSKGKRLRKPFKPPLPEDSED
tara:strand:+ start:1670 stop:1816 length:147 start_codon:yes stop_codon:yes gene_type:complete